MYFTYKSFRKFCKENIPLLILVPIITFMAYGGKIFYQTVSFDLEILMDSPVEFYNSWLTLRRWALLPYKYLSGTWVFSMPMEIIYLIINLMAAMVLFAWLLDVLTDGKNRLGNAVFLTLTPYRTEVVSSVSYRCYVCRNLPVEFYYDSPVICFNCMLIHNFCCREILAAGQSRSNGAFRFPENRPGLTVFDDTAAV